MEKIQTLILYNWKYISTAILSLLVGFVSGYYISFNNSSKEIKGISEVSNPKSDTQKVIPISSCEIRVDISGAVKKPNVYCLKSDSIVLDAIALAGGYSKGYADKYVSSEINLSQKILPNQKIYIPFGTEIKCQKYGYVLSLLETDKSSTDTVKECVNVNVGLKSELMTLDGVGESLAQKIIDGRPYKTIVDLDKVSGIGDLMLEKLKPDVCF